MNAGLLLDLYELTMAQSYFVYKAKTRATFDLFVRALPRQRSYLIACGLADVLDYIRDLRFRQDDLRYLRSKKLFSAEFLKYLERFRFRGDIWAMPEGTVFFPPEPVIRVTGSIIEAQLIESFLLSTLNLQTMIASKASRVVNASEGRGVYDFSLRRTQGTEAAIKVARSSYIAGFAGTSNVLASKLYGIPASGTMAHSFVMSFKQELASFLAYSSIFPARTILLVDTYDTGKGIANAIAVGLYLKEQGHKLLGIRLDSGDIAYWSKLARRMLDKAGLKYVKIFASGNLDEAAIQELLRKGAPVDNFGVGTKMGVSVDAPFLDMIYKISEVTDEEGNFLPTMKLSEGKITYPGRKQVFRVQDKTGRFVKDILGLEAEKLAGKRLLVKVVDKGTIVSEPSCPQEIRRSVQKGLLRFALAMRQPLSGYRYPVEVSRGLASLRSSLSRQLAKRQNG
ncbi:MAG TPA: nicotinate phosphoribosyltransferase [Patescibacteria group bacterium]|nr:nicotinate phosphoribosyltransferase [Patescibacteria group bacterium]